MEVFIPLEMVPPWEMESLFSWERGSDSLGRESLLPWERERESVPPWEMETGKLVPLGEG
jgi:hypothetical protein